MTIVIKRDTQQFWMWQCRADDGQVYNFGYTLDEKTAIKDAALYMHQYAKRQFPRQ